MDESVEQGRVRRLYRALADGDRAALDDLLDPDFVGVIAAGMPFDIGGRYEGAAAMRKRGWGQIAKHFDVRAEPDHILRLEDGRLLASGRYRGTARSTGAPLDAAFTHLISVSDERITGLEQLTDTARWAAALDLGVVAEIDSNSGFETLAFDVSEGVATIRLNRPESGNAINPQMTADLNEVTARCADDPGVRAVLLCAAGPAFTAGGDLKLFAGQTADQLPALLRRMIDTYHLALDRLATIDAPVVAAVRGPAAGGGLGMVCVADIVLATPESRYVCGYGAIGLAADGGTSWYLPRLIGHRRAQEMFLRNRIVTAPEALDWGLITEIVPDDELDDRALRLARELAAGPTAAFGLIRRLLNRSLHTPLGEQLSAETQSMVDAGGTADAMEGIGSFVAKRAPKFQGR